MDLVLVLFGGLITAAVTWFVTPRVERRARSLERWEGHLLELGELVSQDLGVALQRAYWAWKLRSAAEDMLPDDGGNELQREHVKRLNIELSEAMRDYQRLIDLRGTWLVARVVSRVTDETARIEVRWTLFSFVPLAHPYIPGNDEQIEGEWERHRESLKKLAKTIEEATKKLAPPGGLSFAMRYRTLRYRARLRLGWHVDEIIASPAANRSPTDPPPADPDDHPTPPTE